MHPRGCTPLITILLVAIGLPSIPFSAKAQIPVQAIKIAPELHELAVDPSLSPEEPVRVIVQTRNGRDLPAGFSAGASNPSRPLPLIGGYAVEVPRRSLTALAADQDVLYISLDRETWLLSNGYDYNLIRRTTGAENVIGNTGLSYSFRSSKPFNDYLRSLPAGPNGRGVTIAVLDSGIYDQDSLHEDFQIATVPGASRILTHLNFVSTEKVKSEDLKRGFDPYGHGTHVAGVAAGTGLESLEAGQAVSNFYPGVAFNANLLDLRVIGSDGRGRISDAIAAIDWMIRYRQFYGIRVANFSIGAAVTQSYKTDPLCQAVERAVRAGIVCVAAAGNFGKDEKGNVVYGSILAPANDPLVLTVGATNTWGTTERYDDSIASYSSRGPTLVDAVCKPDVVAPGTLIRSVASPDNHLVSTHDLSVYSQNGNEVYMWLSGTSISAPVVSGIAALMLDVNPGLTPAHIKSILQFTAEPLSSLEGNNLVGLVTQGAGCVNADAAVRMAAAIRRDAADQSPGSPVLISDSLLLNRLLYSTQDSSTGEFTSNIAGQAVGWGTKVVYSEGFAYIRKNNILSVYKTAGWQITPSVNLLNVYLSLRGEIKSDGLVFDQGRLLTRGVVFDQVQLSVDGVVFDQSRLLSSNAWLLMADTSTLSNPSAVQSVWSANLIDQGYIASGLVFDQHRPADVLAGGEQAPGKEIVRIQHPDHPLFPRGKRIKK